MSVDQKMFLRPLHVIHIDDSRTTQIHVEGVLALCDYPKFVTYGFKSLAETREWMGDCLRDQIDCVLLDLQLVESTGIDTFMTAVDIFKSVPIIVLSGTFNADLACQLIYQGAESCVTKGAIDGNNLPFFIAQAVARKSRPPASTMYLRDAMASLLAIQDRSRASTVLSKEAQPCD